MVGDFPRFSYVLAFDNELIAASLGHQFGKGQQKDGYEYLEKIIQVPLQLPQAHRSALRKFSLDLVDKAIQDASATLTDIEVRDFLEKYDMAFVPALEIHAWQLGCLNSISFSVPLVYKEVNISDLLIIEAIKIFYPDLYYFIRQNSTLFLTSYNDRNRFGRKSQADEAKEAKEQIDNALKIYEPELAEKIQRMLLDLFPQLNGLYHNHYYSDTAWADWYRELKICSRYYFERYFTYVVKRGRYFRRLFHRIVN